MTDDTVDPMDELSKRRLAREIQTISDTACDIRETFDEYSAPSRAITDHFVKIGLREDAIDKGLWTPIADLIAYLAARMTHHGLSRDACSQVLYGAWRGRECIPEIACMGEEVAAQTRRHLDWALDELVPLCTIRDRAPQVAWFAMSLTIDLLERAGVPSRV